MLTVEREESLQEPLLSEWRGIFVRDSRATPFSSPAWAAAWWPHWGRGARAWLLTVRDGGRLVGLAPLFLRRRHGLRVLYGLGTIVGNYWNVIAPDAVRQQVVAAVVSDLLEHRGEWDALSLDRLPAGSELESVLEASGLAVRHRPPTAAPALELPASFDAYLATLSANRRGKVRRYLRPLDRGEVEVVAIDEPQQLAATVESWQRLRRAWWRERGRDLDPEHDTERFRRFTQAALAGMVPDGLAVAWELRRAGEVVGVALNFTDDETFYYWLGGFDPRLADLRLGHAVVAESIRRSIEAGRRTYDFMIGAEGYKYEYGATDRFLPWIVATSPTPRSRTAGSISRLLDGIRRPGVPPPQTGTGVR